MTADLVSDEQLAEWEALAEAATEGPWDTSIERYDPVIVREGSNWPHGDDDAYATAYSLADAQFIAASRAAVPALVQAFRDARAENQRLRVQLSALGLANDSLAALAAPTRHEQNDEASR